MPKLPAFDVGFSRAQFPENVWDWAFFENAGGSFTPRSVIARVAAHMGENPVYYGAPYPLSAQATRRIEAGIAAMAGLINADSDEVMVGPSTTANVYFLSHALLPLFNPGDEIVVTNQDHEANSGAWRRLAEHGVTVREWRFRPETCELMIDDLESLLSERTRLVCFPHCSNLTGGINDARAIIAKAHDAGALVCLDGVAFAPHRSVDVKDLDADFYLFSAYKVYGPHVSVMYGKRELLLKARGQNHFFIGEDRIPLKLNPGGPNHELTSGLAGVGDYFDALYAHHFDGAANDFTARARAVFSLFEDHEQELSRRFLDFLATKKNIRLLGRAVPDGEKRAPTFSFVVDGVKSQDIPPRLEPFKVAVRAGHFYAYRLPLGLGLDPEDGVVRASMTHYTTIDEVDRLIQGLDQVL